VYGVEKKTFRYNSCAPIPWKCEPRKRLDICQAVNADHTVQDQHFNSETHHAQAMRFSLALLFTRRADRSVNCLSVHPHHPIQPSVAHLADPHRFLGATQHYI